MIPLGGQRIADARLAKKRPADMVIVSLVGVLDELNPIIVLNTERKVEYEWWFLHNLKVMVYTSRVVKNWRGVLEAIAKCKPSYLGVWDVENQEGADVYYHPTPESIEKPQSEWQWKLDFLPWLAFQNKDYSCT